jgi:hypothetical protein
MARHGVHKHLKEQAIVAILQNTNVREASIASNIPERTLFRWLNQDDFKAQLEECKRSLVESAVNQLRLSIRSACEVLKTLMLDQSQPGAVRCSAAKAIIAVTLEATTIADLEARVKTLEGTKVINSEPHWSHDGKVQNTGESS